MCVCVRIAEWVNVCLSVFECVSISVCVWCMNISVYAYTFVIVSLFVCVLVYVNVYISVLIIIKNDGVPNFHVEIDIF